MHAGEVEIKERISMTRMAYSVLMDEMTDDECGWSKAGGLLPPLHSTLWIGRKQANDGNCLVA
jgi:hypothetical protein